MEVKNLCKYIFLIISLLLSIDGFSQRQWIGAVDTDWENPANWNGGTLPSNGDDITIDGDNYTFAPTISSNSSFTIDDLVIRDAGILNKTNGSLIIGDDFFIQGGSVINSSGGLIDVNDEVYMDASTFNFSGGSLDIGDDLNIEAGSVFNSSVGTVDIGDDIIIDASTLSYNGGDMDVDEIINSNNSTASLLGGTITIDGALDANSGTTFNIATTLIQTAGDEDLELGTNTTFNILPGANITGFNDVDFDGGGGATFNMTGGFLDLDDEFLIAENNNTITVSSGTLNISDDLEIRDDDNSLTFTGDAVITIGDDFDVEANADNANITFSGNVDVTVGDDFAILGDDSAIVFSGDADIDINDDLNFTGDGNSITTTDNVTVDVAEEITFTDGTNSTFNVGGSSTVTGDSTDDITAFNVTGGGTVSVGGAVLPVEFLSVTSNILEGKTALIEWATASEKDNHYFTIESSSDLHSWIELGITSGAGNSLSILNYSFVDKNPIHGVSYYRIKQTDYNGDFSYSKIISQEFLFSQSSEIAIFPNPSSDYISIKKEGINWSMTSIHNSQGTNITYNCRVVELGIGKIILDITQLPEGSYIIKGTDFSNTFVKQ